MRCEDALRLLATYLDGELDHASAHDVRHHLEVCRSCYSRAEFEKGLKSHLKVLRHAEVAPPFAERIRTLVRQFSDPNGSGGAES
jgi:anti-sigma factor (TIGR02949 family)